MKTFFEQTIIENIDFTGYDLNDDMYVYDKIKTLYNIFKKEYGYMIKRVGEVKAFEEWLMGLPSSLTVPFYNYDILERAIKSGREFKDEHEEDNYLESYWMELSKAFFTLLYNL